MPCQAVEGGGQILGSTLVAAPRQRNAQAEKDAIKAGKAADEAWPDESAKAAQKNTDARWTVKFAKARTPVETVILVAKRLINIAGITHSSQPCHF